MVLASIIAILSGVVLLYVLLTKWRHKYWTRKGVTQLEPNVIFGDYGPLYTGKKSLQDFFLDIYRNNKPTGIKHVGIYNIWFPEYIPFDTNVIKRMLTKDFSFFGSHGMYHHKSDPLSMHLFAMDGEAWKDRRVKLTPVFTTGKMKMMFDTVSSKTAGLTKVVNKHIDSNEPFNIKDTLARFTTDIIGSVAFGLDCDTLNEPNHQFREIGRKALKPSLKKFVCESLFSYDLLAKFGYHQNSQDIEAYFTRVVKETINYRETNNVQRKDFMQLMIQLKNQGILTADDGLSESKKGKNYVSEQDIINEAFLFYLAGFETSSSTMTFAFFELAQNLDIQEKLREEIIQVLQKYDGKITYDAIMEMEYLDRVMKETLRKYPVVSILPRECTKRYQLPDSDIVIEKGTKINIPVIGIHLDPEYYPNPEQFNPDNFSPENKAKRPDMTWLPFGEGPRQCIGLRFGLMQSKVGTVALLKDFRITLDESMKPPYEALHGSLVYTFKKDIMVKATRI